MESELISDADIDDVKYDKAAVLFELGKYDDALEAFQEILRKKEKLFKLEGYHPDILSIKNQIAIVFVCQGRHKNALKMFRSVIKETEERLDASSLYRLINRDAQFWTSKALVCKGNYYEAYKTLKQVMDCIRPILEMAVARYLLGDYGGALVIFQDVLNRRKGIFSGDHPSVLSTMHEIAIVKRLQGKYEEALKEFENVLDRRKKIFKEDHPDTLSTMHAIAVTLSLKRRYQDARKIFEGVLEARERILEKDHPDTLSTKHEVAIVLFYQGKREKAIEILEEVLKERKEIFGKNHSNTLETKKMLKAAQNILNAQRKDECSEKNKRGMDMCIDACSKEEQLTGELLDIDVMKLQVREYIAESYLSSVTVDKQLKRSQGY